MSIPEVSPARPGHGLLLPAAFLAWMFAGLENSLFVLIHRQMMSELLGPGVAETTITRWFAWNQAAFMLGAAAGGWLFGVLGDRYGRTRAMGWSVLCYSLLTLSAWFVHDPQLMWLIRFLACLGFGGSWPNAVALVAEACPATSRPLLAGLLGSAANFGFVLLGVLCYYVPVTNSDWRWVLLVGASPAVLGIWILLAVPESLRWLKAREDITRVSQTTNSGKPGGEIAEVFSRPLVYRTLLGISLGAVPVVGTAANANWVVPWTDQVEAQKSAVTAAVTTEVGGQPAKAVKGDPRQKARTQIVRSSGAIFGSLMGGLLATLVGRRLSYFLISLSTFLVSSWLFTQLYPGHPWFPYFTFLLGFFGVTYFGWLPLFLPELFPTRVRSTGSGISFNSGRIVAAMVVILVGLGMDRFRGDYAKVGFWSGMIYLVGMIIIWFAPRKAASTLEDQV